MLYSILVGNPQSLALTDFNNLWVQATIFVMQIFSRIRDEKFRLLLPVLILIQNTAHDTNIPRMSPNPA
jgi:hypothetical protein